jgi:hypothetical protein
MKTLVIAPVVLPGVAVLEVVVVVVVEVVVLGMAVAVKEEKKVEWA